jgi:hypothetical protein
MYVNGKIRSAETISGMGKVKGNDAGDELNYDIL